jgi:hypothetical protein
LLIKQRGVDQREGTREESDSERGGRERELTHAAVSLILEDAVGHSEAISKGGPAEDIHLSILERQAVNSNSCKQTKIKIN